MYMIRGLLLPAHTNSHIIPQNAQIAMYTITFDRIRGLTTNGGVMDIVGLPCVQYRGHPQLRTRTIKNG